MDILGVSEQKVCHMICDLGLSQIETMHKLGYSKRHIERLVMNSKIHFGARNLAQLGSLWEKAKNK